MSNIISYPKIPALSPDDLMLISDVDKDGKPLRSVSIGKLASYIEGGGGTSTSINGEIGEITFVSGNNVTIDQIGKTFVINSTVGGSGDVGGSGTAKSLPVWTDGTTLGDSIITNNGLVADVAGYLSVTTPGDPNTIRLSGKIVDIVVDRNTPSPGDGAFGFLDAADNTRLIQFGYDDDGPSDAFAWNYTSNGGFKVGTNNIERLRVNSSGNLTVGNNTTAATEYSVSMGKWNLSNQVADDTAFVIGNGTDGANRSDAFRIGTNGDAFIKRLALGEGALLNDVLCIQGGSIQITNEFNTIRTYHSTYGLGGQDSQYNYGTSGPNGLDRYYIAASSNQSSYIDNGGNFGIGTMTPTSKLHVVGDGLFDGGNVTADKFILDGGTSDDVLLGNGTTTSLSGISGGGGGITQNLFETIAVAGQDNIVADSATDTLNLAAGTGIELTTNALTDTVTIAAAGGGGHVDTNEIAFFVEWTSSDTSVVNFSPMAEWDISGMQWQWNYDGSTGRYLLECKNEDWFAWDYRVTMSANMNAFSNGKLIQVEMLRISKSSILVEAFQIDGTGVQRHDIINTDMRGPDIEPELGSFPQGLDIRIKRWPITV